MHTPLKQPQEVRIRRKQTPAPPKPANLPEALFRNTSFITPKTGGVGHRQQPPAPSSGKRVACSRGKLGCSRSNAFQTRAHRPPSATAATRPAAWAASTPSTAKRRARRRRPWGTTGWRRRSRRRSGRRPGPSGSRCARSSWRRWSRVRPPRPPRGTSSTIRARCSGTMTSTESRRR